MPAQAETSEPATLQHGSRCPICNNGVLYITAVTDDGYALRCFNCGTVGTVHAVDDVAPVVGDEAVKQGNSSPTGFQLTESQLAAKREAGVDPFAAHDHPQLASFTTASAPAAEPVEPHEQHDLEPRTEGENGG